MQYEPSGNQGARGPANPTQPARVNLKRKELCVKNGVCAKMYLSDYNF